VFRLDPSGNLTVLADMGTGQAIGSDPQSGLILDHDGNLYGVATGDTARRTAIAERYSRLFRKL
jgi:hypothetical protein